MSRGVAKPFALPFQIILAVSWCLAPASATADDDLAADSLFGLPRLTIRWPDISFNSPSGPLRRIEPERLPGNPPPTRWMLTQQNGLGLFAERDAAQDSGSDDLDITQPGPDMGDYPNSAYTLKRGRVQLEMAGLSMRTKNNNNASAYATPFLFRYGVTDDVEFRVLGTGFTALIEPNPTTGFGVITLDTKIHLWNDRMEYFIPAMSFEATLQTQWGSSAFQAGIEPGININMDFPFTEQTNFEATIGYSGNLTDINFVTRKTTGSAIDGATPTPVQLNENI
ncbi:MAG: hypothetical protein U0872_12510, partial [Planctomycetaceae bacterium]